MSNGNGEKNSATVKSGAPQPTRNTGTFGDILTVFQKKFGDSVDQKPYKEVKFGAIVLYSGFIQMNHFRDRYDPDFVDFIENKSLKLRNPNSRVIEIIFFAPEISGCLPYPNMGAISKHLGDIGSKGQEEIDKLYLEMKKGKLAGIQDEFKKLTRLPRAYIKAGDISLPKPQDKIQVTFPYEYDFSKAAVTRVYKS